jgi:hypothetical protein
VIRPDRCLAGSCSREQITCIRRKRKGFTVTIIEIRPFRNGWKVFEAPGVEPVFLKQEQAIDYATCRACFRSGEIRILKSDGAVERIIPFDETERRL